jgi:hypothetical protein
VQTIRPEEMQMIVSPLTEICPRYKYKFFLIKLSEKTNAKFYDFANYRSFVFNVLKADIQ